MLTSLSRLALLLLLLPVVALSQATIVDDAIVPFNKDVIVTKTKDGIPVYFLKNSKPEKRMDLILTVDAGAVLEEVGQYGLAHFCEHMAFNGTKDFPKQKLIDFLESTGIRFGADLNAYTNFDETVYMLTVPTDKQENLINAIKVMRDWAAFVSYETQDIEEERGVVLEEWRLSQGANSRVRDQHRTAMYNGSAYASHDVIGDTTTLKTAPPDNLRKFYRRWYGPKNMALILVGDVNHNTINDIVTKYMVLPSEAGSLVEKRPFVPIPDHKGLKVSIASDPELQVAEVEFLVKHRADTVKTYANYRRMLVEQLTSSMLNSRLQELAQKANPPFTTAGVGKINIARQYRHFYASATTSGKNLMVSANTLFTELERAKRHGFVESELQRAKDQALANIEQYYNERDKSNNGQFAQELSRHVLTAETVPGIAHEYEIWNHYIPLITAEECKAYLNSQITEDNRTILLSIPSTEGSTIPTEKQMRDLLAAIAAKDIAAYEDNVPLQPLMATEPKAGTITSTKNEPEIGGKHVVLSNGVRVILKKTDYKNDEILLRAEAFGGQSLGPEADHITISNAADLVDASGIAEFDAPTLIKMLQGKTISLSPYIALERHGLRGSTSPKDVKTFFELLYLYFTQPRMDMDAVASWKTRVKSVLENQDKSPERGFFDTVRVTMSGNHPRSRPLTIADLDKVDPAKALEFYKSLFSNAASFTFTITGNFDEAEMENMLKTYVASLPATTVKTTWKDVGMRTPKGKIDKTVRRGTDPKSFVILVLTGKVPYTPENRYDLSALSEVMEMRLLKKLREEAGGVYFVSVQANADKIPEEEYSVSVVFSCNPERVDELINITLQDMDTMAMKPVESSYTDKVREIHLHEREVALKTNEFWSDGVLRLLMDGEPFSNIEKRKQLISSLTAEQVHKAAQKYLKRDNYARFVLKPVQQ